MTPRTPTCRLLALWACSLSATLLLLASCGRNIPSTHAKPILRAWVEVRGKSMLPTFPENSYVEIEVGSTFDSLQAGNSVVYWDYTHDARIVHHRLVNKVGNAWIVQGDNPKTNPTADKAWVTEDNFIARSTGQFATVLTLQ